jgi:putative FmdB family regulatory protein
MPIYEYECRHCGKRTELLQKMDEPPLAACPECGGEVKKLLSAPAVQFKGSGWYVTDYGGKKGGAAQGEGKSDEKPAAEPGKDSGKTKEKASEAKPAGRGSGGGSSSGSAGAE